MPVRPDVYVVAAFFRRDGMVVLTDGRGRPLRPTPAEQRWLDWDRRRQLSATLFATAAARENSLTEIQRLRHKAAVLRQRAVGDESRGRPAHAKRARGEATKAELGAETRAARAEDELAEIKRLQGEARKAGCSKLGTWLRRAGGDVEGAPAGDVAADVH